ncbi:YbhB/YbcL family Raf kinase inhibitor-like protein [Streptomyces triticisoli]|uniref:YbhB/YbcL family Raf kinase inhibitor-like protein n=1 Tax=Streptomyces triticisoli TaxID=2182797 RepID=UPI002FCDD46D
MAGTGPRGTAFSDPALVPWRHARDGGNVSPPLSWSGASGGAAELLLLCEDPDAGQSSPGGRVRANGWAERGWGVPHPPTTCTARSTPRDRPTAPSSGCTSADRRPRMAAAGGGTRRPRCRDRWAGRVDG